jgi:hypothetical protein
MTDCAHLRVREDEQGTERLYCEAMERYIPGRSGFAPVCRGEADAPRSEVCDVFEPVLGGEAGRTGAD